jgi:uroporphyrinogen decarboxylase
MNSLERIVATLAGKPLDRRAFIPVLSLYGARLTGCSLQRYYSDPMAYLAGQIAVHKEFQPDMLCGPFAFALIGAAFGSELKAMDTQPPNVRKPAIGSLDEWDELVLPDIETNPFLLYFREAIRAMAGEFSGRVPIAACLPAPIDLPALVMGMEGWLDLVLFNKAGAERVMAKAGEFFVSFANCLFAEGAMVAVLPCAYASPTVLMREPVDSLMGPALARALGQLHGPTVLHHCGAALLDHLDLLVGLPSVIGYALDYHEGLAKARQVLGPGPVLLSGPPGPSLVEMDAIRVKEVCRTILEERDREMDNHFILVTLGADVPWHTPPENLQAMRESLGEVGWSAA